MERKNVFRATRAMVYAVFFMALVINFGACTQAEVEGEMPTLTSVDSIEVVKNDTVVIDKDWKVNVIRVNKGDTLDITVEMENPIEKDTIHGKAYIWREKTGYQIFESQLILTPSYANGHMTGGRTMKENITATGWNDVTLFCYPTEDGNIVYVKVVIEHHKGKPVLRVTDSQILSLLDPSMATRSTYKVADAPIKADDLLSFETEGFVNDVTFNDTINTRFERDLMAEDDIKEVLKISEGTKVLDETSQKDSVVEKFVMKSGKTNEVVKYNLRNRLFKGIDPRKMFVNAFDYRFDHTNGTSAYKAETKVAERSNDEWSVFGKTDSYGSNISGDKPFTTEYTFYTERAVYKDKWIEAEFPYITVGVEEGADDTNVKTVDSDLADYDKAVITNSIRTNYAGFAQGLSELVYIYKKAIVPVTLKSEDWDYSSAKKSITPTSIICSADWIKVYSDGHEEKETVKKTFARNLIAKSDFTKDAADNSQRTGEPSVKDLKVNDKRDGEWSWKEEVTTISSDVKMNGASAENVWEATEANEIKVTRKGKTLDFGRDSYSYRNTAKVGTASVSGDYAVYPYSATLSYTFANADVKNAVAPGKIRVEEKTFFPKEWGKLQSIAQTTTISENTKKWDYVWSLHFYNENTKKYFVLPVILTYASPDVPVWNFSYVEECDKKSYDLYNSAYYYNGVKNAVAEDNREWMQWSIAATGSEKLAYGTIKYRTAADKAWDWESAVNGRATVFTHRYEMKVTDGRLFVKDTYNGKNVTDSHCVNGGWK
jgi:hypothetical protein